MWQKSKLRNQTPISTTSVFLWRDLKVPERDTIDKCIYFFERTETEFFFFSCNVMAAKNITDCLWSNIRRYLTTGHAVWDVFLPKYCICKTFDSFKAFILNVSRSIKKKSAFSQRYIMLKSELGANNANKEKQRSAVDGRSCKSRAIKNKGISLPFRGWGNVFSWCVT